MSRRSQRTCYQTPLVRLLERLLHKRTKILVGNSPAVVDELRQEAPGADIRLIRNGVSVYPRSRLPSPMFRMICIANGFAYKGHADLITALDRIGPALPQPWSLTLVGRDTAKYARWPNISSLGFCEPSEIPLLLANADLFVLPSHEEGSSNALLEAMACGVPVVATDVGGNRDAVVHGRTGWLVEAKNPAALAAGIMMMAENRREAHRMAKAAQRDVAARFSFAECVKQYEELYRSAHASE